MTPTIEHINVRVSSINSTQAFLAVAFPHFRERGNGYSPTFGYWSHFGDENTYVALSQNAQRGSEVVVPMADFESTDQHRLMHIGLVVSNIEEVVNRLKAAGYEPFHTELMHNHPYRQRAYCLDGNGIEWEFLQYLSDSPAERNDYSDNI